MNMTLIVITSIIMIGVILSIFYKKNTIDKKIEELNNLEDEIAKAEVKADKIIRNSRREAETLAKELEIKAKEDVLIFKTEAEKEIKEAQQQIKQRDERLSKKEENLDLKVERLEEKEVKLATSQETLDKKLAEAEELMEKQQVELERVADLSRNEAKELILAKLKNELSHESAMVIKEYEDRVKEDKSRIYKRIISTAIGKGASNYVADVAVSVVNLPNDEMKGRIIGREGRNIRAIEAATGVDVIIDDTPEAVVISCFNGIKREIARNAIEKLISDGRIHPAKIEECVEKAKKETNKDIMEAGEHAILELGIPDMHPELIKTIGMLKYRTSYGQNILEHSIEVAKLSATLAAEIGADVTIAKRGGLLHDVGKVLSHDIEASHAIIGGEFLKKFNERPLVINAVMAHHDEVEFECVEAIIVKAADALSASRPGARRETLSTYLKRLEELEEIANSFPGVENSYAIQAGREIRIAIDPNVVSDDKAIMMSRDVAKQIEEKMQYPGQIKVTIIRETRASEFAK